MAALMRDIVRQYLQSHPSRLLLSATSYIYGSTLHHRTAPCPPTPSSSQFPPLHTPSPFPINFDFPEQNIPSYCSKYAHLADLLYSHEQIYTSWRECLQAPTNHNTALAAKEKENRSVEAAKKVLDAAAILKNLAVILVRVADNWRILAYNSVPRIRPYRRSQLHKRPRR